MKNPQCHLLGNKIVKILLIDYILIIFLFFFLKRHSHSAQHVPGTFLQAQLIYSCNTPCGRYYCNYYPHVIDEKHRTVK